MFTKWPILWPSSLLSNSVYRNTRSLCLGVLLMAAFSVAQADIRLTNISTRAPIQGGANDVIAGFIITGTGAQKVIIRGWGLETGVNPKLTLQKYPSGEFVATNDNWQTDSRASEIPTYLVLPNSTDAGLLLDLPVGAYTATLSSVGAKGLGLIGVDTVDGTSIPLTKLSNISTRAPIQGGANDVIAGLIITGTGTQKVMLRGFALEAGVNPKLTLQKYPSGEFVATNDNWQTDSRVNEIPTHLVLPNPTDAGLLLDLAAGAYTVTLSSVGEKGLGLVGVDAIAVVDTGGNGKKPGYNSNPASGSTLDFGNTPVGKPVAYDLLVSEDGDADLVLNSNSISGTNTNDFRVLTTFPLTLPDNAVYVKAPSITIQCTPSGENLRTASLQINSNDGTHSYPLQCTGIKKGEPVYFSYPKPGTALDFGKSLVNTSRNQNIPTIGNEGNADLTVNFVTFSGKNSNNFNIITPKFPVTIASGGVPQAITMQCKPPVVGLREATLQLSSNDPNHNLITYPLKCQGVAKPVTGCPALNKLTPPDENLTAWLGAGIDSDRNWLKSQKCLAGTPQPLGNSKTELSAKLISSFKDVLEIKKKSAGGKLSIGFFNAHAKAKYQKMFRETSYTQSYVLNYDVNLGNVRLGNPSLSQKGRNLDACSFRKYCGDKYVTEITKGGRVYVEMNFTFKSQQQKREFSAGGGFGFEKDICCTSVSVNLEASVSKLSKKTKRESSLEVVAHQEGGKVENLINIFGSKGNTTTCSLDNLAPCKKAVNDIITYIQKGFAPTLRNHPSILEYKYVGFDSIMGVPSKLISDVTAEITQARQVLAAEYQKRLIHRERVNKLLQYTLPSARKQKMTTLKNALTKDVNNLSKAANVCFSDLSQCVTKKNAVIKTLTVYQPSELNLRLGDGQVAHYPLNINANDASGNENHGNVIGKLTYVKNGKFGNAANFDGSTYIQIPKLSDFRFVNEVTFSVWLTVRDNPSSIYRGYISLAPSHYNEGLILGKDRTQAGKIYWENLGGREKEDVYSLANGSELPQKGWLHVVGIADGKQLKLYVNGVLQETSPFSGFDLSETSDLLLRIGGYTFGKHGENHNGLMDEVRIWQRGLSEREVKNLYNSAKP
jgi:hypothetical protein